MYKKILLVTVIIIIFFAFLGNPSVLGNTSSNIDEHWAKNTVNEFMEKEYIPSNGSEFFPDDSITVGEMAYAMNRYFSFGKAVSLQENLEIAHQKGIFLNVELNDTTSRQEIAVIICKLLSLDTARNQPTTFQDDSEISEWAKNCVYTLQMKNIVVGYPDLCFKPKQQITKAEFITIISRCKDLIGQDIGNFLDDKEVSNLEIGIFKYENEKIIISPIMECLELKSGDMVNLSVAIPPDYSGDETLNYELENEEIVEVDEDLLTIAALKSGNTFITFYLDNSELKQSFEIIVTE